MPRLYDIHLRQPKFEVSPFQPVAYKPVERGASILSDSIDKLEEKQRAADTALANVVANFSNITDKLNTDDEDTMNWWKSFQDKYINDIDSFVASGNYNDAIRYATKLGAEAANDKELLGRINSSSSYKKEIDDANNRRRQGKVLQESYDWFVENNPYYHMNITNDKGEITGGYWKSSITLYDDVNWIDIFNMAAKIFNPDSETVTTGSENSVASYKNGDGSSKSSSRHDSRHISEVKPEDIMALTITLARDTTLYPQLIQQYEKDLYRYKKWKQELEYISDPAKRADKELQIKELGISLFDKNGNTTFDDYLYKNLTNAVYANSIAHVEKSITHTRGNARSSQQNDKNGGGGGGGVTVINQLGGDYQQAPKPNGTYPGPHGVMNSIGAGIDFVTKATKRFGK